MPVSIKTLYFFAALLILTIFNTDITLAERNLQAEPTGNRLALVIGNKDYARAPLQNPVNDARDIKAALEQVGFRVIYRENADLPSMDAAVREFVRGLNKDSVGVVYYSGHGAQANGGNYLIPVGTDIDSKAELKARGYDAGIILDEMKDAGNKLNIVILDACRNNPFKGFKGGPEGLATMSGAKGSIIAYATAPGSVADDNTSGRNGTYTTYLKQYLVQPGLTIEDMFKKVSAAVLEQNPDQVPWVNWSFTGDFCFAGCGVNPLPVSSNPAQVTDFSIELSFWESIKDSRNPADFQAYLTQYPNGKFAALARNRLVPRVSPSPTPAPYSPPASACNGCPEIPGGSFMMGSSAAEKDNQTEEKPRHAVQVGRFALGKYEVTRQQFAAFVDDNGYTAGSSCWVYSDNAYKEVNGRNWRSPGINQDNSHPAVCINLSDVQAYIRWLNGKTGRQFRLPTEAEWEYAARAGSQTARYWGDNPDDACSYANVADQAGAQALNWAGNAIHACTDGYVYTAPVGSFQVNGFGLYDMLGNVWEWTCSASTDSYNGSEKLCANDANTRPVIRGGSWGSGPASVRSALRGRGGASLRDSDLGFRLAQDR